VSVVDVEIVKESRERYLTYALSVVSGRALPDVRDGLKPVQRRILFAMLHNLHLNPEKSHRKSAAVVGEVIGRYHPHGDSACYDALVRMAQDFTFRYPLIDGQGNFGSLDGDSAAAYRYTEAKLTPFALEVLGDLGQDTIEERDNFDQTVKEPVVLPSRVPNLLLNGASGIAVGMATSIPPHCLTDVFRAAKLLLEDEKVSDGRLVSAIRAPDFPTGCSLVNTKKELKEIYTTGRGAIRMRADYTLEKLARGKLQLVVSSIPFALDKAALVAKIADLIISRKLPLLTDIRDESTDEIRIVMELASGADEDAAMAYLYKHTSLENNFNVNLTALIPTANPYAGKPVQLSLRDMLQQFIDFRLIVTRRKLLFEKGKLEERVHLLDGLVMVLPKIEEVIKIVQKSSGRADAAQALIKRFKLSERQAYFIVDLRIYQLSKTSLGEIKEELAEKKARLAEIEKLLKSKARMRKLLATDFDRIVDTFGDKRMSKLVLDAEDLEYDEEAYVQHEDVFAVVTADGWTKRLRQTNDPNVTRVREGDALFFVSACSTKDLLLFFTNLGNLYATRVADLPSTSGYGDPVQKLFSFGDGEQVVGCDIMETDKPLDSSEIFLVSKKGLGLRLPSSMLSETKRTGKRLMRVGAGDEVVAVGRAESSHIFVLSIGGYGFITKKSEFPLLSSAGKGVIIQRPGKDDQVCIAASVTKKSKLSIDTSAKNPKELSMSEVPEVARAKKGLKVIKRGLPVKQLTRSFGE